MTNKAFPEPRECLARLLRGRADFSTADIDSFVAGRRDLRDLGAATGMRSADLRLVVERHEPGTPVLLDRTVGGELGRLVSSARTLPAAGIQRLREFARSLPESADKAAPESRSHERYPPGFGALLMRMAALRNLDWTSMARVMGLMSGVHVAASTIGQVGRGVKDLDATLLTGFAAVLGIPVATLADLTGVPATAEPSEKTADLAALLWEVRHLTAAQIRDVTGLAKTLRGPSIATMHGLAHSLIEHDLATEPSIVGCTSADLAEFRRVRGGLPVQYAKFLTVMGREAGALLVGTDFFYPAILEVGAWGQEVLDETGMGHLCAPGSLVLGTHQGYIVFWMEPSGQVHRYVEGQDFTRTWPSLLEFLIEEMARVLQLRAEKPVGDHRRRVKFGFSMS